MSSETNHASVKLYWVIAGVLCAITFVEWAVFKVESIRTVAAIMIPGLVVLSIAKFVLVCGWYMHLRYDHNWLGKIFVFSTFLACLIFGILLAAM